MNGWVFLGLAALVSLTLAACGGGGDNSEQTADPAAGHSDGEDADSHGDQGAEALHVILKEWSIAGEDGETTFTAVAGDTLFEVHNEGAAPHDLKVIKTDLSADDLPFVDRRVDVEAAGETIGGVDPLPGEIQVETRLKLEPGRYVLICSIPGHYQQGMFAELTVE